MRTSSISAVAGSRPPRSTAARMATAPRAVAGTVARAPPNLPIGVRAAETMYTWPLGPGSLMAGVYPRARPRTASATIPRWTWFVPS